MKTFFKMYKSDEEFRKQIADSKGFCIDHFKVLCEGADEMLSDKERADFYQTMLPLMRENINRVYEDVAWFVEKYDYKNRCRLEKFKRCDSTRHAEASRKRSFSLTVCIKEINPKDKTESILCNPQMLSAFVISLFYNCVCPHSNMT
jgi:hypothetical protein